MSSTNTENPQVETLNNEENVQNQKSEEKIYFVMYITDLKHENVYITTEMCL